MEPKARTARNYRTANNKIPFRDWVNELDGSTRQSLNARIRRIEESGNYGDCEPVGEGVFELKFDIGPGYRIYFGIDGEEVIVLTGGIKNTQPKDIATAKSYWEDYNA